MRLLKQFKIHLMKLNNVTIRMLGSKIWYLIIKSWAQGLHKYWYGSLLFHFLLSSKKKQPSWPHWC